MRYIATIAGQDHEFEVEQTGEQNSFRLRLADNRYDLDLRRAGPSSFSILIGDRVFDFEVTGEGEDLAIASREGVTRIVISDLARRAATSRSARAAQSGRAEMRAMMPGRVVSVLVSLGDEVATGAGVLVIEAMKMENELKAPKSGKVIEIRVVPGQTVEKGELLVIIE
ncbi:MAG: hypothetical protein IVW54_04810 [Candidatus Binataceae bacterium]|nr:hypothetical protein [Candidatus Binataceae bacterium]